MNTLIDFTKMIRNFFEIAVEETKKHPENLPGNFNFAMSMVEKYLIELNSVERFKWFDTNKIMETCELVFYHYITDNSEYDVYCKQLCEDIADILDCYFFDIDAILTRIEFYDDDDYSDSDDDDNE